MAFDHKAFFTGLLDTFAEHGLTLVGGDLAKSAQLHTALTLFGRRRSRSRLLHRNRARAEDRLWLGGPVGESAAGRLLLERGARVTAKTLRLPVSLGMHGSLAATARAALSRHLEPDPQLALGAWLAGRRRAAVIDVSDGVLLDLERLARASRVACELDATALPSSEGFEPLCRHLAEDPATLALTGGEDYVLLFALPDGIRPPAECRAVPVGRVTGVVARGRDATVRLCGAELPAGRSGGWDHLT